jgi:hypothetical protein
VYERQKDHDKRSIATSAVALAASMDIEHEKDQLVHEMKSTAGCRFNAAERLGVRDRRRTAITSFASAYVIILTVLPLLFHLPDFIASIINIIIIVFSIVILISSLLQYSSSDPVKAEQHHRCALEINALRREFRIIDPVTLENIRTTARNYDDILQKYSINHEPVDFERYKLEHPDEYPAVNKPEENKAIKGDIINENRISRNIIRSMTSAMILAVAGVLIPVILRLSEHMTEIIDAINKILRTPG